MHYNSLFVNTFQNLGFLVVYQPSCLQQPYNQQCWPIHYPNVIWTDNTIVVMHCQDFVSIQNNSCPELVAIEQHFGDRAAQVVVVHWNYDLHTVYTGPLRLIYFPTHSYELLTNLNATAHQWKDHLIKPRQYNWQCLNGLPKLHRRWVANQLKHYSNGILSLGTEIPLVEYDYSTYHNCNNEENWQRLLPIYSNCDVNIVTETQYTECPGIISEKTLMAFLALQVPIVIGYRGIINHCRQLGFDMFDDIVDNSFDQFDDHNRWKQAIELNCKLLTTKINRSRLADRLLANQQHALSWPARLQTNFKQQVLQVMS